MTSPLERTLFWSTALTVAVLSAGVGCSSSGSEGGGDTGGSGATSASGGTGASGGTSGTQGLGGSGGSGGSGGTGGGMPNPPAAGFSITLTEPSPTDDVDLAGRTCNVGADGVVYTIGAPAPGGTVPDGTDGVAVSCSVAVGADGSSMDVVAAVGGPDTATGEAIAFSVESTMIQSRDSAPAFITFTSDTRGQLSPVSSCTLGPFATLKSGAMLADFTCKLGSADDASVGCKAHGTIGVEYCQTGN